MFSRTTKCVTLHRNIYEISMSISIPISNLTPTSISISVTSVSIYSYTSLKHADHAPIQIFSFLIKTLPGGNFPGGPVVKKPPSNAGDAGLITGRGTKIPHAAGQLNPHATTTKPVHSGAHAPQLERSLRAQRRAQLPQLRPNIVK